MRRAALFFLLAVLLAASIAHAQPTPRDADVTIDNPTAAETDGSVVFTVTAANFDPGEEFIVRAVASSPEPPESRFIPLDYYFALTAAKPQELVTVIVFDNFVPDDEFDLTVSLSIHTSINGTPQLTQASGVATVLNNDEYYAFTINGTFETDAAGWKTSGAKRKCGAAGDASDCAMKVNASNADTTNLARYKLNLSGIPVEISEYLTFTARYKTGAGGALKMRAVVKFTNGQTQKLRPLNVGADTGGQWHTITLGDSIELENNPVKSVSLVFSNLSKTDAVSIDNVTGDIVVDGGDV